MGNSALSYNECPRCGCSLGGVPVSILPLILHVCKLCMLARSPSCIHLHSRQMCRAVFSGKKPHRHGRHGRICHAADHPSPCSACARLARRGHSRGLRTSRAMVMVSGLLSVARPCAGPSCAASAISVTTIRTRWYSLHICSTSISFPHPPRFCCGRALYPGGRRTLISNIILRLSHF